MSGTAVPPERGWKCAVGVSVAVNSHNCSSVVIAEARLVERDLVLDNVVASDSE